MRFLHSPPLQNPNNSLFFPFPSNHSLRAMSAGSTQRMFQLKVDPLTGNSEWVVVEENDTPNNDYPKFSLASTSYLDMLNDTLRNRAYLKAIEKTITKPCHVIDIGAGTGLLSMMAAGARDFGDASTCSSSNGTVTACESYLPMVKLMRKVLRANGMERKVRAINKRSDDLEVGADITSRADVLVSEILDSELLGEGLIPTLQHAHDNLLEQNPQTVPYRATIYGQLVEGTHLWKLHDLFNNEEKVLDDIHLVPKKMDTILSVKPQQFALHCDPLADEIKLLSQPFKVFEFDFWKRPESHGKTELKIRASNAGNVHAVISWWVLQLDSEGEIFYLTAPKWSSSPINMNEFQSSLPSSGDWCDHWKQCVWFTRGKGLALCKDDDVYLDAIHTNTSISYEIKGQPHNSVDDHHKSCSQSCEIALPPERVAMYGDGNWRSLLLKAIKNAVISLLLGLQEKGSQYLQAVAAENGCSMDHVKVLKKQELTMLNTCQKKVDLLIGEPYYYGNEGALPWQNLRFWKDRTVLDSVLSKYFLIMPCKGVLKACAMQLPDLWRSRCSLKDIEGFDHSVVNATLGACGGSPAYQESPCLPFAVWQCGETKRLSEIYTVMEFDFFKPISPCSGKVQVRFREAGICHGFSLWIDWVMDWENAFVLKTGPDLRYWKQGIKLLAEPMDVVNHGTSKGECCSTLLEASFDPSSGELAVKQSPY